MKKFIGILLIAAMLLTLAACGNSGLPISKKKTITIEVTNIGNYEVVQTLDNAADLSIEGNVIKLTVENDADYPFIVRDESGTEYSFVIVYKDGSVDIKTEDDLEITVVIR